MTRIDARKTESTAVEPRSSEDRAREVAVSIARTLDLGRAVDVVILEVKAITLIADYFVIASGTSQRHVKALADKAIEENTWKPIHVEGYELGYWVLLDYGDVVVHIFREAERSFYGLERLWGDAPRVDLEGHSQRP